MANDIMLAGRPADEPANDSAIEPRAKGVATESTKSARSERFLPIVLGLFVASGCAALIYEIVWFQLLELVIGSSAVSVGVLLGTYMGGMCLGSLGLSRFVRASAHPLRVYALLEIGIGACGLLMLVAMPFVQNVYTAVVGYGLPGLVLRGFFAALCLLPPTILMGATLPAAARWVSKTPGGVAWLGYFYGANTLGAVLGCVLAGFVLLRVFDMPTASYVAAGLNAGVALVALALARFTAHTAPAEAKAETFGEAPPRAWLTYVAIGLSGATALGAEVLWTRQFWLLFGGTTYTFSLILAVFLVGIGLGSAAGSTLARRVQSPRHALGMVQLLSIAAIAWCAWNLACSLPYLPINPSLASSPWFQFQIDLMRCLWAVLPAACLWGASFPLALSSLASRGLDGGRLVGRVYAANTAGAIVGALGMSLGIIGWLGTQIAERILLGAAAAAAIASFGPTRMPAGRRFEADKTAIFGSSLALGAACLSMWQVPAIPSHLVAHGRTSALSLKAQETYLFVGEGLSSSLAVSQAPDGTLSYHNAGKVQASTRPEDMRLQRMLGHLTTLVPDQPKSVLVIACGAGVTAGAVSVDPRVERLTIAEIEPLVPEAAATYFGEHNHDVIKNPKTRVEIDDARHFLNTTRETFDAITSDPFDPWVKGAAALYTEEFWSMAKQRLNPGGVVTVFVQLYQAGTPAVKSEIATFFKVFPEGLLFANNWRGEGYDVVLVGQRDPKPLNVDAMSALLERPGFGNVRSSLEELGFDSVGALLATYGTRAQDLAPWMVDAQLNRDRDLRLQFLAGFDLNSSDAVSTYRQIRRYRRYPDGLFVGSPQHVGALRAAIQRHAH
jgi:spermidine synthase